MPMTTSSVPHLKEHAVAETPKKPEAQPDAPKLAPAGQSGDPEVQRLLAMRDGHVQTAEAEPPDVTERRRVAREAIADIDRKLADLGYAAA